MSTAKSKTSLPIELDLNLQSYRNTLNVTKKVLGLSKKGDSTSKSYIKDYTILHYIKDFDIITCYLYNVIRNQAQLKKNNVIASCKGNVAKQKEYLEKPLFDFPINISIDDFIEWTGNSKPTVIKHLDTLEAYGFIKSYDKPPFKVGKNTTYNTKIKWYAVVRDMEEVQDFELEAVRRFAEEHEDVLGKEDRELYREVKKEISTIESIETVPIAPNAIETIQKKTEENKKAKAEKVVNAIQQNKEKKEREKRRESGEDGEEYAANERATVAKNATSERMGIAKNATFEVGDTKAESESVDSIDSIDSIESVESIDRYTFKGRQQKAEPEEIEGIIEDEDDGLEW